jgi:LysM repeat protein
VGWRRTLTGATAVVLGTLGGLGSSLSSSSPGAAATVTVRAGQDLSALAAAFGTTVPALAAANGISNPDRVLAGTVLTLPSAPSSATGAGATANTVVVARGQTLTAIATRYGVTVSSLVAANGLTNPNRVLAGTRLVVPPPPTSAGAATALAAYRAPVAPAPSAPGGSLPPALAASPSRLALRPVFVRWAEALGVPADLLEAMCWWESGWQSSVVSPTGAVGIGQLEPPTVAAMRSQLGIPALDPRVASDNIEMAAAFLHDLLVATDGNVSEALAGYYQGLTSVAKVGLLPSTTQYVAGISAYRSWFS